MARIHLAASSLVHQFHPIKHHVRQPEITMLLRASFVLLFFCLATSTVQASMLNPQGFVSIVSPPSDISNNATESDSAIIAFPEQQNVTLSTDIAADITVPGISPSGGQKNLSPGIIPAGTTINSYFIHFDAVGSPDSALPLTGSVSFDSDVLGLLIFDTTLNPTHTFPGLPGTLYSTNGSLEIVGGGANQGANDQITLSLDRRTVSFNFRDAGAPDDVRIITSVPEPSTIALLGTGLLFLLAAAAGRFHGKRILKALAISALAISATASPAGANFVYTHQGAANPTSEGFTGQVVFGAGSTFGPIADDLGKPAWRVTGSGQSSQYGYFSGAFTASQIADVANQGFTLTMIARAIQNIAPTYDATHPVAIAGSGLNIGSLRFDIDLGINSNGDTVVFLFTADDAIGPGSSLVGQGPSYILTGNDYHIYSLVYSPITHLADLYIDGVDRIQGYAGNTTFHSNVGMFFGAASGGQANINFVQISSVPEPSTRVLAFTAIIGLVVHFLRGKRYSFVQHRG